jgi:hypothetical protein
MPTRKGYDEEANARYRARRRRKHADARTVPGGHKVDIEFRKGTVPARAEKGERELLNAWDNAGGRGNTVEYVPCGECKPGTKCGHGRTQLRKMAPSGGKRIVEVYPDRQPRDRMVTTVVNGKVKVTRIQVTSNETLDGTCADISAVEAGSERPTRWTDHGRRVDGGWKAGARARTESQGFARSLRIERRGW